MTEIPAEIRELAAREFGPASGEQDPDADLSEDFGVSPDIVHSRFLAKLAEFSKTPIPHDELLRVRTLRQAARLLEWYGQNPAEASRRCLDRLDGEMKNAPQNHCLYGLRAELALLLGESGEALKSLEQAGRLAPWELEVDVWRRNVRREMGRGSDFLLRGTLALVFFTAVSLVVAAARLFHGRPVPVLLAIAALLGAAVVGAVKIVRFWKRRVRAKRLKWQNKTLALYTFFLAEAGGIETALGACGEKAALEAATHCAVLSLGLFATGAEPWGLEPDTDLFQGAAGGFVPSREDVREDFHDWLPGLVSAPVPRFELEGVTTIRQAVDLVRRYSRIPDREYERCAGRLDKAIRGDPDDKRLYLRRAEVYRLMGIPARGLPDLDQALSLDPWDVDVRESRRDMRRDHGGGKGASRDTLLMALFSPFLHAALPTALAVTLCYRYIDDRLAPLAILGLAFGIGFHHIEEQAKNIHRARIRKKRRH